MVNNLIDGISIKLNQVFGNSKKIYSEPVKQGLSEPCFYIAVLNPSEKKLVGNRYFRQQPFDIHYFPAASANVAELQEMSSDLLNALELITLVNGDKVRGIEMNYEVVDGVLHFFVKYNMIVRKIVIPADDMEILTVNNDVKG